MTDRANLANGLPVTYDLFDYILERLNKLQQASDSVATQKKIRIEGLQDSDNDFLILAKTFNFKASGAKDSVKINFPGVVFATRPLVTATINDKDSDTKKGPQAYVSISDVTAKNFKAHTFYSGKLTENIPVSINYIAIGHVRRAAR